MHCAAVKDYFNENYKVN